MFRRAALALASLMLISAPSAAAAQERSPAAAPDAVAAIVPPLLADTAVPSVSVARIVDGRIAWAGAWGMRRPGSFADPDTLYNVASLAKPISAETVLRAASALGIDLDEPMAPFWVDPDIAADPRHRQLTPRHVLTHRTGFPNWRNGRLAFQADPGGVVGYSGEGFEYLARYLERRTGETFEALAERLVFRPAGMTSTAYTARPWFGDRLAAPTEPDGRALAPVVRTSFLASDDVHTTASDYARFLISVARRQGLAPAISTEREQVQGNTRSRFCPPVPDALCPEAVGFGLGWDVVIFDGQPTLWHTGADAGTFTFAFITPATGEGIVILTNGREGFRTVLPILAAAGAHPRLYAYLRAQLP